MPKLHILETQTPEIPQNPVSRRRFMGLMSASAALAGTAAIHHKLPAGDTLVPYTKKLDEVIPGVANYYASTYAEGLVPYSVLVKAREGRPILIAGNDEHPRFRGKTSLRAQAEVIGLYDPDRLRQPLVDRKPATWQQAETRVVAALKSAAANKNRVLLLTPAVISPTRRAVIAELKKALPGLDHVAWEPALGFGNREAAEALYGEVLEPRYHVDRARVVLCLEADLLGGMDCAVTAMEGFARNRKLASPSDPMNRLYVVESTLSITGSKADTRIPARPSAAAPIAFAIASTLHHAHGVALPDGVSSHSLAPFTLAGVAKQFDLDQRALTSLVADLNRAGKESLLVAGPSLPMETHVAVELVNTMLGAEGHTIDTRFAVDAMPLANATEMAALTGRIAAHTYDAVILWDVNPSYAMPDAKRFNQALAGVPLKVRMGRYNDESAVPCDLVLPLNHWLESWNDFEAETDLLTLQQPLIQPLYDTRQGEEVLLVWAKALGRSVETNYRSYLMARWQREVYPAGTPVDFAHFWAAAVHDGVLRRTVAPRPQRKLRPRAVADAAATIAARHSATGLELILSPDIRLWDGRYANIGWLQELPEPITKVCWGNYLAMAAADAARLGVSDGDLVHVECDKRTAQLPVLIAVGQAPGAVASVLGFGRSGSVAEGVGTNLFPLVADDGSPAFHRAAVKVSRLGGKGELYRTQTFFDLDDRNIHRHWTLAEYRNEAERFKLGKEPISLYEPQRWPEHKWGMAIDLSACVGCEACQIACQSENNIPVVGPERVERGRIMHWIRSDIYFSGPQENPRVAHELMLCQQCDDAPCENVCPVAATMHSDDGLNEMVYNRCVGTRYCSNNCPYKVRRFNFFDYTSFIHDPLDLAFNPEVSVRPRGVMEKCTFCVQRIRNGAQVAKDNGEPLRDGDIQPACAVACPADAIVFGDLKDPNSRVSKLSRSNRGFKVLEDLGTRPAITYLAELINSNEQAEGRHV